MSAAARTHNTATSAIPGMNVAAVRRALGKLRELNAAVTPAQPMFICDMLMPGMTIADFTLSFVLGHHLKRHNKSLQCRDLVPEMTAQARHTLATTAVKTAPKGGAQDPFPFTRGWTPKTATARAAWVEAHPPPKPDEGAEHQASMDDDEDEDDDDDDEDIDTDETNSTEDDDEEAEDVIVVAEPVANNKRKAVVAESPRKRPCMDRSLTEMPARRMQPVRKCRARR